MRKLFALDFCMAFSSRLQVISTGTIVPAVMWPSMRAPYCEPGVLRSSRSRSPADKWTNPNFSTMRSHWVPLPEPGAPNTNTTPGLEVIAVTRRRTNCIERSPISEGSFASGSFTDLTLLSGDWCFCVSVLWLSNQVKVLLLMWMRREQWAIGYYFSCVPHTTTSHHPPPSRKSDVRNRWRSINGSS
jgi:hypothetical protein